MPLVATQGFTAETQRLNAHLLSKFSEDSEYEDFIAPSEMRFNGPTSGDNGKFEYAAFADGVSNEFLVCNRRVKKTWRDRGGKVQFTYFYGGDTASTNAIRWNLIFNSHPPNVDIVTPSETNVSANLAGPATITHYLLGTFTTFGSVAVGDRMMGIQVLREGAHASDTYAGVAYIYGVYLEFFPER